jgi:hypothetical protein
MSRRTGSLRDMNTPTIADLRGAVDEAKRHSSRAHASKVDADMRNRRAISFQGAIGGAQVVAIIAQVIVIVVTR